MLDVGFLVPSLPWSQRVVRYRIRGTLPLSFLQLHVLSLNLCFWFFV
uniref:Uncharacterized protein n=1 Tax=Aotus nancymaae TaxID=37293 RepID=A0A2K5EY85_AOTNA